MARIVVAEDDVKQAALVRAYLEHDGHSVVCVSTGTRALAEVRERPPELLILDVMMPELDGRDVLRILRAEDDVPVIMVTALSTEEDQLRGFDLGADDYITKPYSPRQLVARVRAVLRRGAATRDEEQIRVGGLFVDVGRAEVRVDDRAVALTPREFALLEALARDPGRVLSRAELLERVPGFDHFALPRTIDMHMLNLRRKIELDPSRPSYVVTVKGRGYKLNEEPPSVP